MKIIRNYYLQILVLLAFNCLSTACFVSDNPIAVGEPDPFVVTAMPPLVSTDSLDKVTSDSIAEPTDLRNTPIPRMIPTPNMTPISTPTHVPTVTPTPPIFLEPESMIARKKKKVGEKPLLHCYPDISRNIGICGNSDELVPEEVEHHTTEWALPNKDYSSTRSASGSIISSANVHLLRVAWSFPIPGSGKFGSAATNPLISDDIVYFQDLGSNIFALDLESGDLIWDHLFDSHAGGPNGLAIGWNKIFAPTSQIRFSALNKTTGDEIWRVGLQRTENEFINIQPSVYDGKVFLSTKTNYKGNATGMIYALDSETGGIKWKFNTVESEDIWGNPEVNSGGGVWYPPSIDINRGITYWGIGNPAPWPGTAEFPNGTSRPGPNLYTDSVVALNVDDGKLIWYNQVKPHDLFDHDFHLSPIIATTTVNGQSRDIVIGGGKTGTVVAFDADSGDTLWETSVGIHQNDDLEVIPPVTSYDKPWGDPGEPIPVFPGHFGGVLTPMAYQDGIVYAPVVNLGAWTTPEWSETFPFSEGTGELVAIDVNNGNILWTKQFDAMVFGAATIVNDLVFTSTVDGMIHAFDRFTGQELWTFQAPVGFNAWPAVSRDTILFPTGGQSGPEPPALIAFRLGK